MPPTSNTKDKPGPSVQSSLIKGSSVIDLDSSVVGSVSPGSICTRPDHCGFFLPGLRSASRSTAAADVRAPFMIPPAEAQAHRGVAWTTHQERRSVHQLRRSRSSNLRSPVPHCSFQTSSPPLLIHPWMFHLLVGTAGLPSLPPNDITDGDRHPSSTWALSR